MIVNPYILGTPEEEGGGESPVPPSYANAGGTGDRRGSITLTSNLTSNGNALSNMIDGNLSDANGPWFAALPDGSYFDFDFGTPRQITEATFKYNTSVAFGNWKWQGWDGSAWVDIGSSFAVGGGSGSSPTQVMTSLSGNTSSYAKYRLLKTSGSGSNWYWNEMEFKISA